MKTLIKSVLVALTVSVFVVPASAENYVRIPAPGQDTVVKKDTVVKEEPPMFLAQNEVTYTEIKVTDVPEKVATAVATKYEGYAIDAASKGSDNSYRLVIKKDDNKLTVYFNEAGEFLKEEAVNTEKSALI